MQIVEALRRTEPAAQPWVRLTCPAWDEGHRDPCDAARGVLSLTAANCWVTGAVDSMVMPSVSVARLAQRELAGLTVIFVSAGTSRPSST